MPVEVTIPYTPRTVQREIHANLDKYRFSVIVAHRRLGKALDVSTPIPLANGSWKQMGEIKVGDILFDEKGNPTTVIAAHKTLYDEDCCSVLFDNGGGEIVCDRNHLWSVRRKFDNTIRNYTIKTYDIFVDLLFGEGRIEYTIPYIHPKKGKIGRSIIDVEYVPTVPVRCIEVDSPSHLYLCGESMIPTHNTTSVINHLIKHALLNKTENARYAYVAPFFSQAKDIVWTMLNHYTKPIPNVKRNVSELWIEFPNGSRITLYGSDNPDRMRGIGLDGCVIDEVAQCKPELWGEVVRPALMDKKGFCVFIGTPKGIDKFYELYHEACKVDDWYAASFPVTQTNVIPEDELVLARKTMTDSEFEREMMCSFYAAVEDLFIPIPDIEAAMERELRDDEWKFSPLIIGVDVARFGDDASVITVRQGLKLREIVRFRGLDLMELADQVAKYINNYRPDGVFIDVVGLGAGLVDRLRALGYDVIEVNGASASTDKRYFNKRAECWGNMRDWLKHASIPKDPGLRVDLASPKYMYRMEKILLESKEDMKKRGLRSPDSADSISVGFSIPIAGTSAHYDRHEPSTYEFSMQRHSDNVNPYTGY